MNSQDIRNIVLRLNDSDVQQKNKEATIIKTKS